MLKVIIQVLERNRNRLGWVFNLVDHRPQIWCSFLEASQDIAFILDSWMVSDTLDDDRFLTCVISVYQSVSCSFYKTCSRLGSLCKPNGFLDFFCNNIPCKSACQDLANLEDWWHGTLVEDNLQVQWETKDEACFIQSSADWRSMVSVVERTIDSISPSTMYHESLLIFVKSWEVIDWLTMGQIRIKAPGP